MTAAIARAQVRATPLHDVLKKFNIRTNPRTVFEQLKQYRLANPGDNAALFLLVTRHSMAL